MEYHTINCNPRRGDIRLAGVKNLFETDLLILNPFDAVKQFDLRTKA